MTSIDVLIVSYNTRDLLRDCLASIRRFQPDAPQLKISVFDNCSTDGSADMVAAEHPDVRLVRSAENLGFGAANNRLAATSTADYLALLNPDTVLQEDVFGPLLRVLEADPTVWVAGPRLVYPDGEPQASSEAFPSLRVEFAREIRRTKLQALLRPLFDVERLLAEARSQDAIGARRSHDAKFLWATCWMLRRADFPGGVIFDPAFPIYDEDLDLCRRRFGQGRAARYVADVELVHLGGRSSTSDAKRQLMRRGRATYYRRHQGQTAALAYRALIAILDGAKGLRRRAAFIAVAALLVFLGGCAGTDPGPGRASVTGGPGVIRPRDQDMAARTYRGMVLVLDRMAGRRGGDPRRGYSDGLWSGVDGCWRCLSSAGAAAAVLARYDGNGSRWLPVAERTVDRMIADHQESDGSFGPRIGGEDNNQISTVVAGLTLTEAYLAVGQRIGEGRARRWRQSTAKAADFLIPKLDFYVNGNINLGQATFLNLAWRVTHRRRFHAAYERALAFTEHPGPRFKGNGLRYTRRPRRKDGADGRAYFTEAVPGGVPGFDTNYTMVQADHAALLYAVARDRRSRRLLNLLTNSLMSRADHRTWEMTPHAESRHPGSVSPVKLVSPALAVAVAGGREDLRRYLPAQFHAAIINFLQQMSNFYGGESRATEYASALLAFERRPARG